MFVAEFEQDSANRRRGSRRSALALDAGLERDRLGRAVCKVVDLSTTGARLQTYLALTPGTAIALIMPGCAVIHADVVWARDFTAGCRFRRAIAQSLVDRFADAD